MDEAAPQAARSTYSGDVDQALGLLRLLYEYTFGYDPARGFWVIKDGKLGSLLTVPTPEALGSLLDSGTEAGSA